MNIRIAAEGGSRFQLHAHSLKPFPSSRQKRMIGTVQFAPSGLFEQLTHARPPEPQVTRLAALQVFPVQHPAQPLAWSQMHCPVARHCVPAPQAVHAEPPTPHAPLDWAKHWLFAQQPLGQVVASQTQVPAAPHRCPAPHAGPAPQAHPPLVQLLADVALHPTQGEPPMPQVANVDAVQTPLSA